MKVQIFNMPHDAIENIALHNLLTDEETGGSTDEYLERYVAAERTISEIEEFVHDVKNIGGEVKIIFE